ncbi:hypothetical protein PaecuDRAFT_2504 [Paenibacillus curdlanolyticus YK9]|uniref:Uncharacterized protein n=1 Tax=Paenibacillus curdlanolyticus YK9 TaxID=717606 RepID=E0IA15_9BACL|nr:hypothetical protein [Paenibacillus curdlanolyticus]EFM10592.1 hypothetical protein PaecuDRAFT_2504 [Paenibacillus curdlanolyticus YK9]
MSKSTERAKQIFVDFSGNKLQMHRGGQLAEFQSFQIASEEEAAWFQEMVEQAGDALSIRDWVAVSHLETIAQSYPNVLIIQKVTAFVTRHLMSADSIVKLLYAEKLVNLIKLLKHELSQDLLYQSYKAAEALLLHIQETPLVVDPGHELNLFDLKDKRALNNRAQKCLDLLYSIIG